MQLQIEYAWITNQIFHSFSSTVKILQSWLSDAYTVAHSVFKQTVLNVSAQQLQQHTIEICCKMIQISDQWTREAIILYRRQSSLSSWH